MKVQLFVPPKGYMAQRWQDGSSMPPLGIPIGIVRPHQASLSPAVKALMAQLTLVAADALAMQEPRQA